MCKAVGAVNLFKLDMNNRKWEEMEDLKDTILFDELPNSSEFYSPAIASSELGGYIHFLGDNGKIIYSYHVKDKTISLSPMPCLVGTSTFSVWHSLVLECTRLERNHDHSLQEDYNVCVGFESLKSLSLLSFGYDCRLESHNADSKQEEDKDDDNLIVKSVKGNQDKSLLLKFPLHILEMIMEYSVGVEYLKFRSACKRCHLAAPLIRRNNGKKLQRLQTYSLLSPCWQMMFDKHKGIITFTDPMFGDKYFIKRPQELICESRIMCSRYGWLLIQISSGSIMFYNPFTSDIRELPQLPQANTLPRADIYCFSAPPTSPNCMVVGLTQHHDHVLPSCNVIIHFVAREPPSWRSIELDFVPDNLYSYRFATFYGQDLYAVRDDGGLDVFEEIGSENHFWKRDIAKAPTSCFTSFRQFFQVRCDQQLLQVIVGEFGESVEVFKLNDSTREWVKIDGLGKHVIYICGTSSICIDAKTPHMENKIYFPRFSSNNSGNIVFYSLETCRYHTFNNKNIQESFRDFFATKHHLAPHVWIEPCWS